MPSMKEGFRRREDIMYCDTCGTAVYVRTCEGYGCGAAICGDHSNDTITGAQCDDCFNKGEEEVQRG